MRLLEDCQAKFGPLEFLELNLKQKLDYALLHVGRLVKEVIGDHKNDQDFDVQLSGDLTYCLGEPGMSCFVVSATARHGCYYDSKLTIEKAKARGLRLKAMTMNPNGSIQFDFEVI